MKNSGPWVGHCRTAANCAELIASKCGMNTQKAYVLGLLHDIGRRFGVSHFKHIVDGYLYMMNLGYDEVARICLTHSFPTKNIETYIGDFDVPKEDIYKMRYEINNFEYDDYDRLIQLCDCLAGNEGVVDMIKRMDDVAGRYGYYPEEKRNANFELKRYFEKITGDNIYRVVLANHELW